MAFVVRCSRAGGYVVMKIGYEAVTKFNRRIRDMLINHEIKFSLAKKDKRHGRLWAKYSAADLLRKRKYFER